MRSQNRRRRHSSFDQRRFPDHSPFSIDSVEPDSDMLARCGMASFLNFQIFLFLFMKPSLKLMLTIIRHLVLSFLIKPIFRISRNDDKFAVESHRIS